MSLAISLLESAVTDNIETVFSGLCLKSSAGSVQASRLPIYILGKFTADGNNSFDGIQLAGIIAKGLNLVSSDVSFDDPDKVSRPRSWEMLFGPPLPSSALFY